MTTPASDVSEHPIRTPEEIERLFENWKEDPCWDLEFTEGFEAHHDELLRLSRSWKAECDRRWDQRMLREAHQLGLPRQLYEDVVYRAEVRERSDSESAAKYLAHHLRGDERHAEAESIVSHIVDAASWKAVGEIAKQQALPTTGTVRVVRRPLELSTQRHKGFSLWLPERWTFLDARLITNWDVRSLGHTATAFFLVTPNGPLHEEKFLLLASEQDLALDEFKQGQLDYLTTFVYTDTDLLRIEQHLFHLRT